MSPPVDDGRLRKRAVAMVRDEVRLLFVGVVEVLLERSNRC